MNVQTKFLMLLFSIIMISCSGTNHMSENIVNNLPPCPDKPNCVSSQSKDKTHYVDALKYTGSHKTAFNQLTFVVSQFPEANIVKQTENYMHVEFKSTLFGFVDDVEFLFSPDQQIQLKSASRVGYSDFGVNRKRILAITEKFKNAPKRASTNDI